MSDTLDWRELAPGLARRWWLPLVLAVAGAVLGGYAAVNLDPVHRSQGTVLVGPLNSTVTRSTTLRASESLATFYADVARRDVVLETVREKLDLTTSIDDLRASVSATVPDQNPRVVTVTAAGESDAQATAIARAIVQELVSLSPAPAGVTQSAFVSAQADALEKTIQASEAELDDLRAALPGLTDPGERADADRAIAVKQQVLNESRQTYVELMSLEPDSDAGGMTVLDDVAAVSQTGRVTPTTGALLGAVVGVVLGLLVVWLLDRRRRGPAPAEPPEEQAAPTVNLVVRPTSGAQSRRLPRAPPRRMVPPREHVNGRPDQ